MLKRLIIWSTLSHLQQILFYEMGNILKESDPTSSQVLDNSFAESSDGNIIDILPYELLVYFI